MSVGNWPDPDSTTAALPTPSAGRATAFLTTLRPGKGENQMLRHKMLFRVAQTPVCDCGYDPAIVLDSEEPLPWGTAVSAILDHIRKSRRWKYLGLEFHYGLGYYIWENGLTSKRWAIQEAEYLTLTGVTRFPRLQVTWTAPASGVSS
jgi:hypothetical protein